MRASVIIPAHNAEAFISRAVTSALAQTISDLEVIVINDRSTDQTHPIVEAISAHDNRVRIYDNEGPPGPSAARNTALRRSTGKWIAILDADDAFHPERLSRLIKQAEEQAYDAIIDDLWRVEFETDKELGPAFGAHILHHDKRIDIKWLLERDFPGMHGHKSLGFCKPIYRKGALDFYGLKYAEDISVGEDFLLLSLFIMKDLQVGTVNEALYIYYERPGSMSRIRNVANLVEVNDRVAKMHHELVSNYQIPSDKFMYDLSRTFRKRRSAFWYEQFSHGLKNKDWLATLSAMSGIDPLEVTLKFARALKRRTSR